MQGKFLIDRSTRRRDAGDTFVPLINIVFLLLIFFLLSATIAPPDPLDVTLPEAQIVANDAPASENTLHVSLDGTLVFGNLRDDAALAAAVARAEQGAEAGPLILRADAGLDGAVFSGLLSRLAEQGVTDLGVTVRLP
jgi:biopolymer transport protein ExbD